MILGLMRTSDHSSSWWSLGRRCRHDSRPLVAAPRVADRIAIIMAETEGSGWRQNLRAAAIPRRYFLAAVNLVVEQKPANVATEPALDVPQSRRGVKPREIGALHRRFKRCKCDWIVIATDRKLSHTHGSILAVGK